MKLSFTKMQGCANDYIYLDCRASGVPADIAARLLHLPFPGVMLLPPDSLHHSLMHVHDTLQTSSLTSDHCLKK